MVGLVTGSLSYNKSDEHVGLDQPRRVTSAVVESRLARHFRPAGIPTLVSCSVEHYVIVSGPPCALQVRKDVFGTGSIPMRVADPAKEHHALAINQKG